MPLAHYRTINGKRYRLYAVVITNGRANIGAAKEITAVLRSRGQRVLREKNVVYVEVKKR